MYEKCKSSKHHHQSIYRNGISNKIKREKKPHIMCNIVTDLFWIGLWTHAVENDEHIELLSFIFFSEKKKKLNK